MKLRLGWPWSLRHQLATNRCYFCGGRSVSRWQAKDRLYVRTYFVCDAGRCLAEAAQTVQRWMAR